VAFNCFRLMLIWVSVWTSACWDKACDRMKLWHCQLSHIVSVSVCGLGSVVEYAHLVSWPSVVKGDCTRVVLFGCICVVCFLWVVFSFFILWFFIYLLSCIFQCEPIWMSLYSLIGLMCHSESTQSDSHSVSMLGYYCITLLFATRHLFQTICQPLC